MKIYIYLDHAYLTNTVTLNNNMVLFILAQRPYVTLRIGKEKYKSKILNGTEVNFKETFIFNT